MKQIGIIGWRGMVGSVLLDRMREERDFDLIAPTFFSTSQAGAAGPQLSTGTAKVQDANDILWHTSTGKREGDPFSSEWCLGRWF